MARRGSVEAFTASIAIDARLYRHDIMGSIAHAKMLGQAAHYSRAATRARLSAAWQAIEREIDSGKFAFSPADEDIHMNIERRLTEKIGCAGGKLHTARSRNDQVALDMRLYLRDEVKTVIDELSKTCNVSLPLAAKKHLDVIMPGYTHLQRAQPVLLVASFAGLLRYVRARLRALCRLFWSGSTFYRWVRRALPARLFRSIASMWPSSWVFRAISKNSIDAVSDRDFSAGDSCGSRRFFLSI